MCAFRLLSRKECGGSLNRSGELFTDDDGLTNLESWNIPGVIQPAEIEFWYNTKLDIHGSSRSAQVEMCPSASRESWKWEQVKTM